MEQVVGSRWRDQWRLDCRTLKPGDDWLSTVPTPLPAKQHRPGGSSLANSGLRLYESRATAALAALKQRLVPAALVLRDGEWVKLPAPRSSPATR